MTDCSTAAKPGKSWPGYLLLLVLLLVTAAVYVLQADLSQTFEGTYPEVIPPVAAKFDFQADRIEIKLSRDPAYSHIIVYAYDEDQRQVCILKPIEKRRIIINPGDRADYRVIFENNKVLSYEVLKKAYGMDRSEDFTGHLNAAKKAGRRYGVQECLYPACSMCLDVCPVVSTGIIKMPVLPDGRIHPVIHYGGCPRCGKCFELCKMGVIFRTDLRHSIKPDFLKNGNIDDPGWSTP